MTGLPVEKKPNKKAILREESIQRLTQAAFRLIVAKGYHACTLHEIAQAAGLTKGAIFFYFESKENLLLRLLDIAEAEIVDTLMEHLESLQKPAPDRIAAFFRFTSQQGIDRPYELLCLIKMSIEGPNSTELAGRRISEIYQRIYAGVEDIVADGKRKGELDPAAPDAGIRHHGRRNARRNDARVVSPGRRNRRAHLRAHRLADLPERHLASINSPQAAMLRDASFARSSG